MAGQIRLALTRQPFADGQSFGDAGPYELLQGRFTLAVDPESHDADAIDPAAAACSPITDLALADRNAEGLVECSGEIAMLRPADLARGNRTLFYDLVNRGNKYGLPFFNNAPLRNRLGRQADDAGNGYLMRRGYSVVWSAWQGDILPVESRMTLDLPLARGRVQDDARGSVQDGDRTVTGVVRSELVVEEVGITTLPLSGNAYTASYPAASLDQPGATLTRRRRAEDAREPIDASAWRFARFDPDGGPQRAVVPSDEHVYYPAAFEPGWLYEIIYEARDPLVMGLGMLGVRELVSFLLTAEADADGNPNTLRDGAVEMERAYSWGISQCGRFLREFVYRGFNALDAGQAGGRSRVFDGVITHVAGAGRAALNYRFAQPGRYPRRQEDHLYPSDAFPFTYGPTIDPVSGREDAICHRPDSDPRILHTQTSSEYWNRGGSLVHTDPASGADLALPENARAYLFSSLEHSAGRTGQMIPALQTHPINPVSAGPLHRAMLDALDAWVREGIEPPNSRVPSASDGTAIDAGAGPGAFPAVPGVRPPDRANWVAPIDRGAAWESEARIDEEPPTEDGARAYPLRLPQVDADGNDVPGIRLPEIAAPLATFTGWNVWRAHPDARHPDGGHPDAEPTLGPFLHNVDGSVFPFAATRADRDASGDPRLSIEERYPTRSAYVEAVRASVEALLSQRLLLQEDAERYLARAAVEPLPGVESGVAVSGD